MLSEAAAIFITGLLGGLAAFTIGVRIGEARFAQHTWALLGADVPPSMNGHPARQFSWPRDIDVPL